MATYFILSNRYEGPIAQSDDLDQAILIAASLNLNINGTGVVDEETQWTYYWVENEHGDDLYPN